MKLKINSKDPRLLEDELGNPMFRYEGDYIQSVFKLVDMITRLEREVYKLKSDLEDLQDRRIC
jgi:hypothetical protein